MSQGKRIMNATVYQNQYSFDRYPSAKEKRGKIAPVYQEVQRRYPSAKVFDSPSPPESWVWLVMSHKFIYPGKLR